MNSCFRHASAVLMACLVGCGSSTTEPSGDTVVDSGVADTSTASDSMGDDSASVDTGSASESGADTADSSPSDTADDASSSDVGTDASGMFCGGITGKGCPGGFFCQSAAGMCKVADG